MVLVDGVKYACQQCIKGHRSSKCTHSTRPLTEIRKKGRPSTQCAHCKELRKTRAVHTRCDCAAREAQQEHVARILPNGLADVVGKHAPEELVRTEPSGVTRLLNPCSCLRGGKCTCCESIKSPTAKFFPDEPQPPRLPAASTSSGRVSSSSASELVAVEVQPRAGGGIVMMTPGGDILVDPATPVAATSLSALYASPPPLPMPYSSTSSRSSSNYLTDAATLPPPPPPPAPAPPFASSNNPLFLPPTAGTLACFCGPTCQCVGCATHDPYSRKRPAPGACSGGGCHCGTGKGCEEAAVARGAVSKKSRSGNGNGNGNGNGDGSGCCGKKKKKEEEEGVTRPSCCGSKDSTSSTFPRSEPMSAASSSSSSLTSSSTGETLPPHLLLAPPPGSAGVALPSLWSSSTSTPDTLASSSNFPPTACGSSQDLDSGVGTSYTPPTTTTSSAAPLPSLRTLWPALLDLDEAGASFPSSSSLDGVVGGSTTTAEGEQHPAPTTTTTVPLLSKASRDQNIDNGFVDTRDDGDPSLPYAPHHLGLPEGLFDPALEPAILRASPSTTTTANRDGRQDRLVLTACSACFLEEPLDDACGRAGGGESGDEEEEEEDLGW
ncbi:hypothetical protein C6P46_006037 [Rhodotorula mucilaginosa]|uniref:Copper-fist domain-containing protein n=1 Tax=Rhodotorula mucilaginosa TaxID=5537 RepID=A0A9P6VXZ1_RHOMI|nr:hypothetical protein C6P46_006037 [Rhodotorula mucilaginosa]